MNRVLLALVLAAPLAVMAAEAGPEHAAAAPQTGDVFVKGDATKGATLAAPCVACHGPGGNSAMGEWPKLAGQGSPYIFKELQAFKSGERKNPIMTAQVATLSEQDMRDLAAYFTQQKTAPGVANPASVATAEPLYRAGDAARGLPACAACHGPKGAGNPAAGYPHIGAQQAQYTATQLKAYKAGERGPGANGQIMAAIAAKLSDKEIDALASYINGIH